jgi:plasmid stabilization system protein ParE
LADASNRLTAKNNEIKQLDQLLQDRDAEIDRLARIIEEMKREKKTIVTFDDNDEWRLRFIELQNRARRDVDNYENELCRKDQVRATYQIILELRDRINQLLSMPPVQTVVHERPSTDDRDLLIARLRKQVEEKDSEILYLRAELAKKPAVQFLEKPEPKVVRIAEETHKEIRYEKDPYLIEQNARLSRDLEVALVVTDNKNEEQNAKLDLSDKLKEIKRLQDLVAELKAMPPRIVIQDKHITKEVEVPSRIGDRAEKLFNIYKRHADELARRLAQDMLYYYGLFRKYERLAKEKRRIISSKVKKSSSIKDSRSSMEPSMFGSIFGRLW